MRNQIYKFILNDGTELNNVNTKHWPCYEYDQIIDRQILESNMLRITITRDDNTAYILKDKILDQYIITNKNTTIFSFKGKYDLVGVNKDQIYTVKLSDGIILENVVIIKFPYYEYNAIIEKDVLESHLNEVIISQNYQNKYTFKNKILTNYSIKNGHTLFQLLDDNDKNISEKEQKYNFTLANGKKIYDLTMREYPYYDYADIIEESELRNNISELTIEDNYNSTITYLNKNLYNYHIMNGHTLFTLEEIS